MENKATIIALSGKGGVGKTSVSAAIVKLLVEAYPDKKILAIDADPAVGLSTALGIEVKTTIDDIRKLVTRDSIIEILILTTDGVVKIGASADNLFNSSTFFDKRYYIEEMEFIECEDFIRELRRFTIDRIVNVLSIDGIPVNKVKKVQIRKK